METVSASKSGTRDDKKKVLNLGFGYSAVKKIISGFIIAVCKYIKGAGFTIGCAFTANSINSLNE